MPDSPSKKCKDKPAFAVGNVWLPFSTTPSKDGISPSRRGRSKDIGRPVPACKLGLQEPLCPARPQAAPNISSRDGISFSPGPRWFPTKHFGSHQNHPAGSKAHPDRFAVPGWFDTVFGPADEAPAAKSEPSWRPPSGEQAQDRKGLPANCAADGRPVRFASGAAL